MYSTEAGIETFMGTVTHANNTIEQSFYFEKWYSGDGKQVDFLKHCTYIEVFPIYDK